MTALLLALTLFGCPEPPECSATDPCPFGSSCVEGVCQARYCATSAQCAVEEHCVGGACTTGCDAEADCYPGDTCVDGACANKPCEDAQRDCAFKEYCNGATGECYEAAGPFCEDCGSDDDCGGESSGNHCTVYGCGMECRNRDDCPAGFDCVPFADYNGNIQYYLCITYCWLYEDYDPDGLQRAGPPDRTPAGVLLPAGPEADAADAPATGDRR